ncbi:pseudouridine synthase [Tepidanaerobacter acetatoxydans]|uniref:pseudouridine synthase n=1 Tax=Tepidanaerobacter acetatoxydans TaxID=499229 RepID=UPI001BD55A8A|nr:pseudouridine synthase [Tepidanaerobacter acetatoxydans]
MKGQKPVRIDKILASCGYGSRKDVKKLIKSGQVSVNGVIINDAGTLVNPSLDEIIVAGECILYEDNVYIMMNKPQDVVSSTYDDFETTVIDLLEGEYFHRKLFPVGRLDKDAEGLIFLTDDGKMAHRLLSPKNRVPKTYYVEVYGRLNESDVKAFAAGMELEDFTALPAELDILEKNNNISSAYVTIYEGKFHQIKRMMKTRGKEVTYLKRLSLGPLRLDEELEPGMWRKLTKEEVDLLRAI